MDFNKQELFDAYKKNNPEANDIYIKHLVVIDRLMKSFKKPCDDSYWYKKMHTIMSYAIDEMCYNLGYDEKEVIKWAYRNLEE